MAEYQHRSLVRAPFDRVWKFHTTVDALVEVTPNWMNLRVESVVGPGGETERFVEGTEVTMSVRPFGIGPRQRWTSRIVERVENDREAYFRDEMIDGPFERWVHTHTYRAHDGGTILRDHVEYALPPGEIGRAVSPLGVAGLAPLFRHRHRRTRELLE